MYCRRNESKVGFVVWATGGIVCRTQAAANPCQGEAEVKPSACFLSQPRGAYI